MDRGHSGSRSTAEIHPHVWKVGNDHSMKIREPNTNQNFGDGSYKSPAVKCTETVQQAVRGGRSNCVLTQPLLSRKKQRGWEPYKGKVIPCCVCLWRELRKEIKPWRWRKVTICALVLLWTGCGALGKLLHPWACFYFSKMGELIQVFEFFCSMIFHNTITLRTLAVGITDR